MCRFLKSVENLKMLNGNNLGFLMAQKVTKLGETLTQRCWTDHVISR
ncbi:hypothetical protein [Parasutterella muris]|uniref:Uncharacterized protein n=1 Tax=Parasutterella muris TaxID=2565572 RepID=A0A6L6YIB8_9BURK|nr:hypothetical protein [Parasutterella muris]MVX57505.1 hypothetical protein [Parasutterella muris]